jgi:oxygen-independent coproporphyrinogen-3 oxidase
MEPGGRRSSDRVFFSWELPPFASIYIHIPFCRNLCGYCHFYRMEPTVEQITRYPESLVSEVDSGSSRIQGAVRSIYVGGGTPTIMRAAFYRELIAFIKDKYDVPPGGEITIEADAGVSAYQLEKLTEAGFNRISLGVKSFSDQSLATLGVRTLAEREGLVSMARDAGFTSVSVDLVYGFEGQTEEELVADLEMTAQCEPDHVSMYALQASKGKTPAEADDDLTASMYRQSRRTLQAAGYEQYEISNFARPGHMSRHNMNYWLDGDYLGFGPSAHSAVTASRTRVRWRNADDLESYMENPASGSEKYDESQGRERAAEALIMALRLVKGVERGPFAVRYGFDPVSLLGSQLERFMEAGLLRTSQDHLRLTTRGMLLSNEVFEALV